MIVLLTLSGECALLLKNKEPGRDSDLTITHTRRLHNCLVSSVILALICKSDVLLPLSPFVTFLAILAKVKIMHKLRVFALRKCMQNEENVKYYVHSGLVVNAHYNHRNGKIYVREKLEELPSDDE